MAKSKTLINGAAYDIKGGRTLIGGTGYDIRGGRTLIGGTGYNIKFYTFDPTKTDYTEAELLECIDAGCANLLSPGTKVSLSNSTVADTTVKWIVLGTNHEGTTNTVDLMLEKAIHFGSSVDYKIPIHIYQTSAWRTYLNGTFYDGFSASVKAHAQNMRVYSHSHEAYSFQGIAAGFTELSDKVKIFSCVELGYTGYIYRTYDGVKYPYFTYHTTEGGTFITENGYLPSTPLNNSITYQAVRSMQYTESDNIKRGTYIMTSAGALSGGYFNHEVLAAKAAPIIRLGG